MLTNRKISPSDIQALEACVDDAYNLLGVLQYWLTHPCRPLLFNGAISDISMQIIESYNCITSIMPDLRNRFNTQAIDALREKRHRAKVFDYTKDINDSIQDLVYIYQEQKQFFLNHHTGFFSNIKRIIQPDTAITKYNGHFITTSLSTLFDLNSSNPQKEESINVGLNIAESICSILDIFNLEYPVECLKIDGDFEMIDIKGGKLFKRVGFESLNNKFAMALMLIMTKLNFIKHIWSASLPKENHTLFRIKFINVYHISRNLSKIQSMMYKSGISETEKAVLIELNNSKNIKWIKKQSQLRNLIVHYQIDYTQREKITRGMTRLDTIELLSKGKSYIEINEILDIYINETIKKLEEAFNVDADTFWYGKVQ